MVRGAPARECGSPKLLLLTQSKEVTNKRKREEEERLERLAVKRAVAEINRKHREQMYPPAPRLHVRVPDRVQEQEAEIRAAIERDAERLGRAAAAPEPPPRPLPVVMAYYPAAAEAAATWEARVSAIEWKLLAQLRDMAPCGAGIARIEVLEKFLLRPEDQGIRVGRLAKLEAAVETIGDVRRFGPRTFY
jgi:hypothetical protein